MYLLKCKFSVCFFQLYLTPIWLSIDVINVEFIKGRSLTTEQVFFILASFFGVGNIASINRYISLV